MKYFNLLLFTFLIFPLTLLWSQEDLTVDITYPTYSQNCQNGAIDLHINNGFPPYAVVWSATEWINPGQSYTWVLQEAYGIQANDPAADISNLVADDAITYTVEVTDALCGIASMSFQLECICADDCMLLADVSDPECGQPGMISAYIDCAGGGREPITYDWHDLPSNSPFEGSPVRTVKPGTYCLTATDVDGCEYENCWEVGSNVMFLDVALVDQSNITQCDGNETCDGMLSISVTPGANIHWQGIPNTSQVSSSTVTDLCPGEYTVQVSMGACIVEESYTIECCYSFDPLGSGEDFVTPISVSSTVNSPDRLISLEVTGGGDDIVFQWTGPNGFEASESTIMNLETGEYCVYVFDGCSDYQDCFEIVDCDLNPITVSAEIFETCTGLAAGSIFLTISGGSPPYSVSWSNGASGETLVNLPKGQYCIDVVDDAGCYLPTMCFYVGEKPPDGISESSIPCARTVICNGVGYVEYFDYQYFPECDELYGFCPITQELVLLATAPQWWTGLFLVGCDLYKQCYYSPEIKFIEAGQHIEGPILISNYSECDDDYSFGFACISELCRFEDVYVLPPTASITCAWLSPQSWGTVCTDDGFKCYAYIMCDGSTMGDGCFPSYICGPSSSTDEENVEKETIQNSSDKPVIVGMEGARLATSVSELYSMLLADGSVSMGKMSKGDLLKENRVCGNSRFFNVFTPLIEKVALYPNPFISMVNIEFFSYTSQRGEIILRDLLGNSVYSRFIDVEQGSNTISIEGLFGLISGVYFVELYLSDNLAVVFEVIKQ